MRGFAILDFRFGGIKIEHLEAAIKNQKSQIKNKKGAHGNSNQRPSLRGKKPG
jgi:hypothetical protein